VNKHLEQIFIKLGVENRSAAASIATRTISIAD
jgi:DNA-binding CsgD family transcriptional regulator